MAQNPVPNGGAIAGDLIAYYQQLRARILAVLDVTEADLREFERSPGARAARLAQRAVEVDQQDVLYEVDRLGAYLRAHLRAEVRNAVHQRALAARVRRQLGITDVKLLPAPEPRDG